MKYRDTYLQDELVLAAAGTEIINLDTRLPIVCLDLIFRGQWGATQACQNKRIWEDIDKIEVVDGSDVLFSMSGTELLALNCYELKHFPWMQLDNEASGYDECKLTIFFGRSYLDTELMLDPTRFVNPQLRVSYSFTIDASHWVTNEQLLTVIARVVEEGVGAPAAFLMSKQIYNWATATSGDETIDMPRDYPYRMIMPRAYYSGDQADEGMTNLKLSCDMDRFVPFNFDGKHLAALNQQFFSTFEMIIKEDLKNDDELKTPLFKTTFVGAFGAAADRVIDWDAIDAEVCTIALYTTVTSTDDSMAPITVLEKIQCDVRGEQPLSTLCIPFGDLIDIPEFFDPTPYKSVRLIITQGQTAAGVGQLVLQQLRGY